MTKYIKMNAKQGDRTPVPGAIQVVAKPNTPQELHLASSLLKI